MAMSLHDRYLLLRPALGLYACIVLLLLLWPAPSRAIDLSDVHRSYRDGNYARALAEFRSGADAGAAEAQYWLGLLYDRGQGVARDRDLAYQWFHKAAQQGHSEAQRVVGVYLDEGKSVPQDLAQAAMWYQRAVAQNNAKAMRNLAQLFIWGRGVGRNFAMAAGLFQAAADLGNTRAMRNLAYLYYFGKGVPRDTPVAGAGLDKAKSDLGFVYYRGEGVPRDLTKAAYNFGQAADQGNADAQLMLSRMYLLAEGVTTDPDRAYFWALLGGGAEPRPGNLVF